MFILTLLLWSLSWLWCHPFILTLWRCVYSDIVTVFWPRHGALGLTFSPCFILTWMFAAAVHGHAGDDQDPTRGVRRQTHLWGLRQQVSALTSLHLALNHMLLVPYVPVPLQAAATLYPHGSPGFLAFSVPASDLCHLSVLGALRPLMPYGLLGTGDEWNREWDPRPTSLFTQLLNTLCSTDCL